MQTTHNAANDKNAAPAAQRASHRVASRRRRVIWSNYLFIMPTIIGLLVFNAGAILMGFGVSLTNYEAAGHPTYIGLKNYADLLSNPLTPTILTNTVIYVFGYTFFTVTIGLGLAFLVNQRLNGITFFRAVFFLPVITSGVAVSLVFSWLFQGQFGPVNGFLWQVFHFNGPDWFGDTFWALPTMILVGVWKNVGYTMVILLAGLQDVPRELLEAARIDGAGPLRALRYISIPMLTPSLFFVIVTGIINSFQVFDFTYVITQGGPAYATTTLAYWIYENAFQWFHLGFACAISFVLFAFTISITLVQWAMQRYWVYYA